MVNMGLFAGAGTPVSAGLVSLAAVLAGVAAGVTDFAGVGVGVGASGMARQSYSEPKARGMGYYPTWESAVTA